ncbi:L-histidine N(alpha)-methyltransferase [Arenicella sp.]|nr:L-histidine N(alpha)-methyltransferase [Arenicella sp.]
MNAQFKKDVGFGLSQPQKHLLSKYFYDKKGDELFMQIMAMPEYYLTRSEQEIFELQTDKMIKSFDLSKNKPFELIELGAGDGTKTKYLLTALLKDGYQFDYLPVDISSNVLSHLCESLQEEMPELSVKPQQGDYFEILSEIKNDDLPKIVLFLGSNIGNLTDHLAAKFVYDLGMNLKSGDRLLIGVDKVKPVEIVLPAYNDKAGITSQFNLNLLHRINLELGGNFDIENFEHTPEYNQQEGVARSFLRSKIDQVVTITGIGESYHFYAGEKIHMEISRKYTTKIMQEIISDTDFVIVDVLSDSQNYFSDYILQRC